MLLNCFSSISVKYVVNIYFYFREETALINVDDDNSSIISMASTLDLAHHESIGGLAKDYS